MLVSLFDFLTLRRPPMGRMLFALAEILKVIDEKREPGLADLVVNAQQQARKTLALQREWAEVKKTRSKGRGRAFQVDQEFDRAWRGLELVLQGYSVSNLGNELSATANKLMRIAFPNGLSALTKQPYENQLAESDLLLEEFATKYENEVKLLNLKDHLAQIKDLGNQLRRELGKRDKQLEWDQVVESRRRAQELYACVIFSIMGRYASLHRHDAYRRMELLEEVQRQDQILLEAYRRHRPSGDIDPDTGEVLAPDEWTEEPVV